MTDAEHDVTFDSTDAGASHTEPRQCSLLRKGQHAIFGDHPCKIVDMSTSKTGKHGHAKVHLVGIDIFTGKKHEELCPSTHNMSFFRPKTGEYQLLDITDDDYLSLMFDDGPREHLKLPEGELGEKIQRLFSDGKSLMINVQSAVGRESVTDVKESNEQD